MHFADVMLGKEAKSRHSDTVVLRGQTPSRKAASFARCGGMDLRLLGAGPPDSQPRIDLANPADKQGGPQPWSRLISRIYHVCVTYCRAERSRRWIRRGQATSRERGSCGCSRPSGTENMQGQATAVAFQHGAIVFETRYIAHFGPIFKARVLHIKNCAGPEKGRCWKDLVESSPKKNVVRF